MMNECFPKNNLISFYYAYVQSKANYDLINYASVYKSNLRPIDKIERSFYRRKWGLKNQSVDKTQFLDIDGLSPIDKCTSRAILDFYSFRFGETLLWTVTLMT